MNAPAHPRRLVLLGSTGSIGVQTLDVVRRFPGRLRVEALSARASADALIDQARAFRPRVVHLSEPEAADRARAALAGMGIAVLEGPEGLLEAAALDGADLVVAATVGWTGVEPVLAALEAGRDIALANKEVLVCAGGLVLAAADRAGARLWPLDSEHNAIAQCLAAGPAGPRAPLRRLVLTCSGGPFRAATAEEIAAAPPERTLAHPTWEMGRKISVDSATLMNKGFEVIEAHHLFGVDYDRIEVVVHPQSIIHSLVEFVDGSMIAQMGATDMRLPIQNILTHPDRLEAPTAPLDLAAVGRLDFAAPDTGRFPALAMAYEAGRRGGAAPCLLNAANEVAVAAHLASEIPCGAIPEVLAEVLRDPAAPDAHGTLDDLRAADAWARAAARRAVLRRAPKLPASA